MATSVFVSWSGTTAKDFGRFIAGWIKLPLGTIRTFYSDDIEKGTRWSDQVMRQLGLCKFGIIVVTSENLGSEWIHFEAGALSQAIARTGAASAVTPLLVDVEPYQLPSTLSQFQATRCTRDDIERMLTAIRDIDDSEVRATDDLIRQQLEAHWISFQDALEAARVGLLAKAEPNPPPEPSALTILSEIRTEVGNLRQLNESILRRITSGSHSTSQSVLPLKGASFEATLDDDFSTSATYQFPSVDDAGDFVEWLRDNHPSIEYDRSIDPLTISIVGYDEVGQYDRLDIQDVARSQFDGTRL